MAEEDKHFYFNKFGLNQNEEIPIYFYCIDLMDVS